VSKVRVPIFGRLSNYVAVEANATVGATVGLDLRWPDGSRVTEDELRKAITAGAVAAATPAPSPANPVGGGGTSYTDAMADLRVAAGITAHVAEDDPHPQYLQSADISFPYSRIDAAGDIRIGADGSLRVTYGA